MSCTDLFSYKTTGVLFISMYFYIVSFNSFQIRPKKTEFPKSFGLIIYSNRGHAWKITPTRAEKSQRRLINVLRVDCGASLLLLVWPRPNFLKQLISTKSSQAQTNKLTRQGYQLKLYAKDVYNLWQVLTLFSFAKQ